MSSAPERWAVAVEEIKRLDSGADLAAGIEAEKAGFARVLASQDAREGTAAFVETRPPRFGGSCAPRRVR